MNNRLIKEEFTEDGKMVYKMATFEIDVIAKMTGGLAPTICYMHNEREVTDEIRAIRFHFENPASYIEDYPAFQSMLFQKEQRAMNELYESISLKPKNMATGKQILWSLWVMLLVALPLLVTLWIIK